MTGLTSRGYGSLIGAYGLAADNLLSAQVVTADGQLVIANADEHPTYWGLRGAVATLALWFPEYRLHPLTTVLSSGCCCIRWIKREKCCHRFNEFIATAPDELTIRSGFLQTPDGQMLFLSPTTVVLLKRVSKRSHPANLWHRAGRSDATCSRITN